MTDVIRPEVNLRRIHEYGPMHAQAKAERIYLEEFRKSKKAILMREAEVAGHKTTAAQEREAYANADYVSLIEALRDATEKEEEMRWKLIQATTAIEVWRTQQANNRAMDRSAA